MAKPAAADRIPHILTAIQEIETNTSGLTLDEFKENRFRQLGIERCLEIISEASRQLPDVLKDSHPEIPWRRIADMGVASGTPTMPSIATLSGKLSSESCLTYAMR